MLCTLKKEDTRRLIGHVYHVLLAVNTEITCTCRRVVSGNNARAFLTLFHAL